MQKNSKIAIAIALAAGLAGTGIYATYVLSPPPSPCSTTAPATQLLSVGTNQEIGKTNLAPHAPSNQTGPKPLASAPVNAATHTLPVGQIINVVAAENFWGNLVSQIGGTHVNVTSIVTDPNTDPHEYQANDSDAIAIKNAQYVIVNNVGYDQWATQLIASDGVQGQTILNVGDSLGVTVNGGIVTGNPHLWYNPAYVNQTVAWMFHNLSTIAPGLTGYFTDQYNNLTASLGTLYSRITAIKDQWAGTEVASTESIFVYLANASGLDLVSPPEFMEAVAQGIDPPDPSVVQFQCQLESGHVKVLVYNEQTVTPITQNLKVIATEHNVSVIGVTETIQPINPPTSFQEWMGGQLQNLQNALNANALGK